MQDKFTEVANQFQSVQEYEKYIQQVENQLEIKIYRFMSFKASYAKGVYADLCKKYKEGSIVVASRCWHENERRLYVWYLVCYLRLHQIASISLSELEQGPHWDLFSKVFFSKDIIFLKYQYLNILKNPNRINWVEKEDEILRVSYELHAKGEWNEMAKYLYFESKGEYFKTPKQCRERWQNHLDKKVLKTDWTPEEELIVFQFVRKHGTKWAKIAPLLNNSRTEHMIKNRYKSLLNKKKGEKAYSQVKAVQEICLKLAEDIGKKTKVEKELEAKKEDQEVAIPYYDSEEIMEEVNETIPIEKAQKVPQKPIVLTRSMRQTEFPQQIFNSIHQSHFDFSRSVVAHNSDFPDFQNESINEDWLRYTHVIEGCRIQPSVKRVGNFNVSSAFLSNSNFTSNNLMGEEFFYKSGNSSISVPIPQYSRPNNALICGTVDGKDLLTSHNIWNQEEKSYFEDSTLNGKRESKK